MIEAKAAAKEVNLRPMSLADVPLGMRLKNAAGWNQTPTDWRMLLDAGFGLVASVAGVDVGTATVVPYSGLGEARGFSWIGMVLVDPAFRRRGIGTRLLEAAVAAAQPYGAVGLDATPQGQPLYAQMGFVVHSKLVRMLRPAAPLMTAIPCACEPVTGDVLPDLVRWDAPVFGAERGAILAALARRTPSYAYCTRTNGALTGYVMGRHGQDYEQLGPVVAADAALAHALLLAALDGCAGRDVIVDVPLAHAGWTSRLTALGFVQQRTFTRMMLGRPEPPGGPAAQFAIAGPEMG